VWFQNSLSAGEGISVNANLFRARWLAPSIHLLLFSLTLLVAITHQSQPLFDGPADPGFNALFFADLPISLIAFSMMWDRHFIAAITLWGVFGTIQWYFWGVVIERVVNNLRKNKRQQHDDMTARPKA
jgi:hypothetical protein